MEKTLQKCDRCHQTIRPLALFKVYNSWLCDGCFQIHTESQMSENGFTLQKGWK